LLPSLPISSSGSISEPIFIPFSGSSTSSSSSSSSSGSNLSATNDTTLTTDSSNSSSSGSSIEIINQLNDFNIVYSPLLPKLISLPLVNDEFSKKAGVALVGSNPAFEIEFDKEDLSSGIVSVDLEDAKDNIFPNISFMIINILDDQSKLILDLNIPDNISTGTAKLYLNLAGGKRLDGIVQIVNYLNLSKVTLNKEKSINKPQINKITIIKRGKSIALNINGSNFVGNKVFVAKNEKKNLFQNKDGEPYTSVTFFPNNLDLSVNLLSISNDGRNIVAKLSLLGDIEKSVKGVISVSTPRGIVSVPVLIKK